jgi:chloramphenicol 3-O phosphotransferase
VIIFLNGTSSSGKTSVARALQDLYTTPLMLIGFDTFIAMLPKRFIGTGEEAKLGHFFEEETDKSGHPVYEMRIGEYAKRLYLAAAPCVKVVADEGNDIIVDEILYDDWVVEAYLKHLKGYQVHTVAIKCPLEVIEEREKLRVNRKRNHARAQFGVVHEHRIQYDMEFDTSQQSSSEIAEQILAKIKASPTPKPFVRG